MSERFVPLGSLKDVQTFQEHLRKINVSLPCDAQVFSGPKSPFAKSAEIDGLKIGNRFCIHPMEGWDGTADGQPSEQTLRRWNLFGLSGAKLIWGGEAVAVQESGRANPNQLLINANTRGGLAKLRETLIAAHKEASGSADGLVIGLQLTHSGRFARPNVKSRAEPRILYRHPVLDRRLGLGADFPLLSDGEIRQIVEDFHRAAKIARELGYDFVDVKHCHGYLGHEFLSAHTRDGAYGGSFENRTRFLREIVEGIRRAAPGLKIGVRVSIFDFVPFLPDPTLSTPGKPGPGVPESAPLPYRWGFGTNSQNPVEADFTEPLKFLELLRTLKIGLVNLSAGSPYYNPHIQRPALYPPSDGYQPPEDPLVGVARQMQAVRTLKTQFPDLFIVGSAYTYLQDFLPNVCQAALREGWVDSIGLGRMVLSYPQLPLDVLNGNALHHKKVCRTFSDCTTAPRNGLRSGCYPLDPYYKNFEDAPKLREIKKAARK